MMTDTERAGQDFRPTDLPLGTKVRVTRKVSLGGGHPPVKAGTIGIVRGVSHQNYKGEPHLMYLVGDLPDDRVPVGAKYSMFGTHIDAADIEPV